MKIRFLEETYIRSAPRTGAEPIGLMLRGAEIEVEPVTVPGEPIEGNDRWYRDKNNWYYWSGRTAITEAELAPTPPAVPEASSVRPSAVSTPVVPPLPVPPITQGAVSATEKIPEGETRLVPPLENLLLAEEGFQVGPPAPAPVSQPAAEQPLRPVELAAPRGINIEAFEEPASPPAAPSLQSAEAFWQAPEGQKLNWGIQKYQIARDWWQGRSLTGRDIRIALLSTGLMPEHPDLGNVVGAFQFPDAAQPLQDIQGLGTQAAVVCAGVGQTVFGIAPEAQLLPAKIGEQDHAITPEGLLAGLRWAIDSQADIIAMLVDFPDLPPAHLESLKALSAEAIQNGILLVAPVGTAESKKPESRYPACIEGVLAVGAHDQFGQRCSFSAKSYQLDLLAPGEGLLTSSPQLRAEINSKSVAIAAAFVAGFLALVCQWQRDRSQRTTPEAIFSLLRETAAARRDFNKGDDVEYGHGLLNPIAVLKKLDAAYRAAEE